MDKDEGNCVQFFEIGIGKNMCVALCVIGWISYGLQVATHQYTAQCTSHLAKFPKPTFNSVGEPDYTSHCTFYRHLEGRIGFNTVNPSWSTGKDYPVHSLMMNRMAVLHQNEGGIEKSTPSALEISLDPLASGIDFPKLPSF